MLNKSYDWKRFWCPRGAQISLDYRGYLLDPESAWGHRLDSDLVELEAIGDVPCLVLLGEPGIGKTTTLEQEYKNLDRTLSRHKDKCLWQRLGDHNSDRDLCDATFSHPIFRNWLQGSHRLYLFLDSLDEGLLEITTLIRILKRELCKETIPADRLLLRITCRAFNWADSLEQELRKKWGEKNVGVYKLAPLRETDVIQALNKEGINIAAFLKEVWNKKAISFAIKPITLSLLLDIYGSDGELPTSSRDLYERGCLQLCEETNLDRREAGYLCKSDVKHRLVIASRVAALMVFSQKVSIWDCPEHGKKKSSDISINNLYGETENLAQQEFSVDESDIRDMLSITGLFTPREMHRVIWAHRSYTEFLAAWYLEQHNLSLEKILSLIFHDDRVIPQVQETTAWLASMRPDVFQKVMETDPDVLIQSDISTMDDENKAQLVETLLRLHNEEKLKYSWQHYRNLNYPGLVELLEFYISDSSKSQWSRLVAIDIARDCSVKSVQDTLANIVLDPTQLYIVRQHASFTICAIGDEETKARLKPLALGEVGNDPKDYLKGYALQAVFPQHITIYELIENITQPKSQSTGGTYSNFIAKEVAERLSIQDLSVILKWLEQLPRRYDLHYPFRELADSVMLKAWQNLNEPGVLESFANVAILRLGQHDGILGDRPPQSYTSESFKYTRDDDVEPLLRESDEKRRQLIEVIVSSISESDIDSLWVVGIICSEDVVWIVERITLAESSKTTDVWVKLLRQALTLHNLTYPHWKDTKHVDAILNACRISSAMRSQFEFDITPLELNSEKAGQVKAEYLKWQVSSDPELKLEPPPQQRVLTILETVEAGQPQLWWQIVIELTLIPTSKNYVHEHVFESNITKLPGWTEAEPETKKKIVQTAKKYLDFGDPETQCWLGTDHFSNVPFSGYQALYILANKEPEFISKLPSHTWKKWMPAILKSITFSDKPKGEKEFKICQEILKTAYQRASDEFIQTLTDFMIFQDYRPRTFYPDDVYRLVSELLEQCLASSILDKVPSEDLNAGILELLITDLFKDELDKAKEIAKSFLSEKLPESGKEREKAIVAACALVRHVDNYSWKMFWDLTEQDINFRREILKSVAQEAAFSGHIESNLKEEYLADLYIFLAQQYPEIEQPEPKIQQLRGIEAQILGEFADVRIWKNYIPQRLQVRGTLEACDALRKIICELPEQKEQLQPTLLEAESLARRNTWRPPKPEEILQLVISREPSNSDLSDQLEAIDQRTKKMKDNPKIDKSINIGSGANVPGNFNTGDNSTQNIPPSLSRSINWGNVFALMSLIVAVIAIPMGIFNPEINQSIKQLLNHSTPTKVEQSPQPNK